MSGLKIKNTHDYTKDESYYYEPLSGPLAPDDTIEKGLSSISGLDRATIRGKLDAAREDCINKHMHNPTKYSHVRDTADIVSDVVNQVTQEISKKTVANDVESSDESSNYDLNDWDDLTEYSNSIEPTDEYFETGDVDAGDVNGSDDMVNTSLEDSVAPEEPVNGEEETESSNDENLENFE